jgi:E3 ubiquitin-protein ligase HUWE1
VDIKKDFAVESSVVHMSIADQTAALECCSHLIQVKNLGSEMLHAVMQLASRLTRDHKLACRFLNEKNIPVLLSFLIDAKISSSPVPAWMAMLTGMLLRHYVEDGNTLQAYMESEVKSTVQSLSSATSANRVSPRSLLQSMASMVVRDPQVFMQAVANTCRLNEHGGNL